MSGEEYPVNITSPTKRSRPPGITYDQKMVNFIVSISGIFQEETKNRKIIEIEMERMFTYIFSLAKEKNTNSVQTELLNQPTNQYNTRSSIISELENKLKECHEIIMEQNRLNREMKYHLTCSKEELASLKIQAEYSLSEKERIMNEQNDLIRRLIQENNRLYYHSKRIIAYEVDKEISLRELRSSDLNFILNS